MEQMGNADRQKMKAAEYADVLQARGEKINQLSKRYEEVQQTLMKLRNNLNAGMQHAAENPGPSTDVIALDERSRIMQQIEDLDIEEDSLTRELQGLGVNVPSPTAQ